MASDSFKDKKSIENILTILLIGTIAFILFITPILIKANNNEYCKVEQNNPFTNSLTNSSIILDSNNEYLLTNINKDLDDKNRFYKEKTTYCLKSINNGSEILKINIITADQDVLNTFYTENGEQTVCTNFDTEKDFIGIKCLNCDSSNTLTILENTLSNNEIIDFNGVVSSNKELSINIKTYIDCRESVKKWFYNYIIFLSLTLFTILIMLGINLYGELIFKW